ncbi:DUF6190 family protein [Kitasatospora azatica]|uniref:DUF6190 family protein n=1 Tax=Kitasatospora azatica TaxID=58347 RepID=UPI00055D880B|nr:DUF6190 family protein [Kitasatospora azatica]
MSPEPAAVEFVDATLFLGMNSAEESVRVACKAFFVARLAGRVTMSLEQVGRCDDLVWQFSREVQDAYYPFMDFLHTVMAIDRTGYTEDDLRHAPDSAKYGELATHERLALGMVINRGGVLRTVSSRLLGRPELPAQAVQPTPEPAAEPSFPQPLERLYQQSLALRLAPTAL